MWRDNPNSNTCEEVSRHWCTLKMHFLAPTWSVSSRPKLEVSRYSDTLFYWTVPHQWTWEISVPIKCPWMWSVGLMDQEFPFSYIIESWIFHLKRLWKLWIGGPWGVIIKKIPTFHDKLWLIIIGGKIIDHLLFVVHLISQSSDAVY